MKVSVVTLLWNNWHVARNGVASMRRLLDRQDIEELLILDNGSTDRTSTEIQYVSQWPKTRLIRSDVNLGCGGGRQLLFSQATSDRVLSLDSDAIVVDQSIIDVLETALQTNYASIVGDYGGNIRRRWKFGFEKQPYGPYRTPSHVDSLDGYCHYFDRSIVDASVRFDPQWMKDGPEDAGFCLEATIASGRRCYMATLPLLHAWTQSVPGNNPRHWDILASQWKRVFPAEHKAPGVTDFTCSYRTVEQDFSPRHASELLASDVRHVLEIGSNDGAETIRLLEAFPSAVIHCFEPDPRAAARWRHRVSSDRARLYEVALSDRTGTAVFYQSSGDRNDGQCRGYGDWDKSGSLLPCDRHTEWCPWMKFENTIIVPTTTLDAWAETHLRDHDQIGVAWVAAQGCEGMILRSAHRTVSKLQMVYAQCNKLPHYQGQATLQDLVVSLPGFRLVASYYSDYYLWINRRNVLQ